jgi:hypothetical protein
MMSGRKTHFHGEEQFLYHIVRFLVIKRKREVFLVQTDYVAAIPIPPQKDGIVSILILCSVKLICDIKGTHFFKSVDRKAVGLHHWSDLSC